jgi:O-acetyl-ADP-ribose deacetylase (regulator of RNase III)
MDRAAGIAVRETRAHLQKSQSVAKVLLVCFGAQAYEVHSQALREAFPGS